MVLRHSAIILKVLKNTSELGKGKECTLPNRSEEDSRMGYVRVIKK